MTKTAGFQLPLAALRRSWLIARLEETSYSAGDFRRVLRQVAPERFERVKNKGWVHAYVQLMRHVETLFPVYELEWQSDEENIRAIRREEVGCWDGIPVVVCGLDVEGEFPDSLALLLCMRNEYVYEDGERETPLTPFIQTGLISAERHLVGPRFLPRPPRGRAWLSPWEGLGELWLYANGQTGNPFLDYSNTYMMECNCFPEWNAGEIRALAKQWTRARPMLERITHLQNFIDRQPHERLPLLDGALRNNRDVLMQITRPIRSRRA